MKRSYYCKLVYRKNTDGVYVRSNGNTFIQDFTFLPWLGEFLVDDDKKLQMYISKVHFEFNNQVALAWIDKHGNLIIRYLSNKQTKINF